MPDLLQRKMLKDRIVQSVSRAVKQIQACQINCVEEVERGGGGGGGGGSSSVALLTNEDPAFCRLVEHVDHALLHGLRHVTRGYWVLVGEFTHKATLQQIRSLGNVTTNLGRGRAWLYLALTDHLLESYLRCFVDNPHLVKKYYVKEALVQDDMRMQLLLTLAAGLEYVNFQLDVDVSYLDLSGYPRHVRSSRQADNDENMENTSLCSMTSSVVSQVSGSSTPEQAVDVANLSDVSEALECSTSSSGAPNPRPNGTTIGPSSLLLNQRQSPLSVVVTPVESAERQRILQLPAPQSTLDEEDVIDGGGGNGLEVIRVKVKSKKKGSSAKRKARTGSSSGATGGESKEEGTVDSSDSLSLRSQGPDLESPVSQESQESGYRSVPEEAAAVKKSDHRDLGDGNSCRVGVEPGNVVGGVDVDDDAGKGLGGVDKKTDAKSKNNVKANGAIPSAINHTNHTDASNDSTNQTPRNIPSSVNKDKMATAVAPDRAAPQQNVVFSVTMDSDIKWNSSKVQSQQKGVDVERSLQHTASSAQDTSECMSIYDALPLKTSSSKNERLNEQAARQDTHTQNNDSFATLSSEHVSTVSVSTNSSATEGSAPTSIIDADRLSRGSSCCSSDDSKSTPSRKKAKESCEDFIVRLDNNVKLVLMLEVLQGDDEKILQAYHTSVGHTEGEAVAVQLLMTDTALYVLTPGVRTRYHKDAVVNHRELDYVSLSLNQQVINIVCKYRRKQLWITAGNRQLTRAIIGDLSTAYAKCESGRLGELSVLDDATTQRISLRKWAAAECPNEGAGGVSIEHYALVHWEDRQPGASEVTTTGPSHEGRLMVKTSSMLFGLAGGGWAPGYFVLKNGALMQYSSQHDAKPPLICIQLNCEQCGGCRRSRTSERAHAFEVILTGGDALQLCAASEDIAQTWLQALCQAVSQGMGLRLPNSGMVACVAVVTPARVLLCHEDMQTGFVRTLGAANVTDILHALSDAGAPNYCVLVFDCPAGMDPNKWLMFFNGASERNAFVDMLSQTWAKYFQVELPVQQIDDIVLQKRCRDDLRKLKRKRVF